MTMPRETTLQVRGRPVRLWEKGAGPKVAVFPGFGGAPKWTPFLEALSTRRHVVVPSLPGQPGARGHDELDSTLDWIVAVGDLLDAASLHAVDLVGISVGSTLAAEAAAMWPSTARLVLVGPLGLCREDDPVADLWAQRPGALPELLCQAPERYSGLFAAASGEDQVELKILESRASEAAARLLWPLGDTQLERRLHRIRGRTLIVHGEADEVVPAVYPQLYAERIGAPVRIATLPQAGHLADLDQPEALARLIAGFLDEEA